jgi:hypothetical protein
MERTPVQSTEIAVIGYDSKKSLLEVVFRRGGVYRYRGVPQEVHQQLMEAPSVGTFFTQNIKDSFQYVKVA